MLTIYSYFLLLITYTSDLQSITYPILIAITYSQLRTISYNRIQFSIILSFKNCFLFMQINQIFNPQTIKIQDLLPILKLRGNMDKFFIEESIQKSSSILKKQPNVLSVTSPMVVIGDIHGQFYDLQNIIYKFSLKNHSFLFLGDYVDRGHFCIEVITLLMVLKIQRPNSFHLLRGNHESKNMTSQYNFKQQCCKKYSIEIYEKFLDWFKLLPLAAVIDNKYFCVHGGISPDFIGLNQLQKIKRNIQIPDSGVMCDLMWSDPIDDDDEWEKNSIRGVSYFFSRKTASNFLKENNFKMIIRAHELQDEGFRFQQNPKTRKHSDAYSLTLFSAPNYCDKFKNKGAIAIIKNNNIFIETFNQVQHPVVLPGYIDVFQWSIPFISICVNHLFKYLTKQRDRRESRIQPIKQIATEMKEYESLQFIRELFQKIMVEKNESFPMNKEEKIELLSQFPITQKTLNKQNLDVPGPFETKFQKIQQKVLKPKFSSVSSFGTSSQRVFDENSFNY